MPMSDDPMLYTPPQVNETWGETQFNDCTWASGLALVDVWTLGAVTRDRNWRPFTRARMKAEREALREASGDLTGGSSLEDLARGIAKRYPSLPRLRRSTNGTADFDFEFMWQALKKDCSVLLQGNPSRIPNQKSFLRTAQDSDDYDHSILVIRATDAHGLVMDPLRPVRSKARWVPKSELRQFASRFKTAAGLPYYGIVRRGAQAPLVKNEESCDEVAARARAKGIADAAAAAAAVE